jgi:release factor glutamine methyltransferase
MTGASSHAGPPVPERWTALSMIEWSTAYLTGKGFDEARLHAELLLAHVLGLNRLQLYLQFDRPLTAAELASFKTLFRRRLEHEPLQYVLGETVFMGLPIAVAPGVLIPRPETELLVEEVVTYIRSLNEERVNVLDVGTGSGNIAIAVTHLARSAYVAAVDISPEAIAIARRNVDRHDAARVSLELRDARAGARPGEKYQVVVSNPPYIARDDFEKLEPEVRVFEPRIALTDEADGMNFYHTLFRLVTEVLEPTGRLFCEIGYGQAERLRALAATSGIEILDIVPDLAEIPRVLKGRVVVTPATKG